MALRVEYDRLRTIEDVKRERLRVADEIRRCDELLRDDARRLGELSSPEYWSAVLSEKTAGLIEWATSGIAARIRGFSAAFNLLSGLSKSLFGRFSRSTRPGWRKDYGRRYDFEDDEIEREIEKEADQWIDEDSSDEEDRDGGSCDPCRSR